MIYDVVDSYDGWRISLWFGTSFRHFCIEVNQILNKLFKQHNIANETSVFISNQSSLFNLFNNTV